MHKKVLKITVVDDDADDRDYFQDALREILLDFNLTLYKDGQNVMDDIIADKFEIPDLMFLDLNMPILSGKKLLQEMREMEGFKKIPIIAIYSTSSSQQDQDDTFDLGANAYVTKPRSYSDIKKIIKKVLDIDWESYKTNSENFFVKI